MQCGESIVPSNDTLYDNVIGSQSTRKNLASALRKKGKSYNEIQKALQIPKSTLSLWFRDMRISARIKNTNISRAKKVWAKNITEYNKDRAKKIAALAVQMRKEAAAEIPQLSQHDLKLLGIALYWAEGYKRAKWNPLFCNSDPNMVRLMMRFFRDVCKIPEEKFRPQVQIHPYVSRFTAEQYWSSVTGLDRSVFLKPLMQVSGRSKGKRPVHRLPFGTFRIVIADVKVLHKILGWMQGLAKVC